MTDQPTTTKASRKTAQEATETPLNRQVAEGNAAAKEKAAKMSEARNEAQSKLNAAHRAELNELIKAAAKARGIDWTPQPTEAEKKIAAAKALLEDPSVREALGITGTDALPLG
jgi:hypothetical protein